MSRPNTSLCVSLLTLLLLGQTSCNIAGSRMQINSSDETVGLTKNLIQGLQLPQELKNDTDAQGRLRVLQKRLQSIKRDTRKIKDTVSVVFVSKDKEKITEEYSIIAYALYCRVATPDLIRGLYSLGAKIEDMHKLHLHYRQKDCSRTFSATLSTLGLAIRQMAPLEVIEVLYKLGADIQAKQHIERIKKEVNKETNVINAELSLLSLSPFLELPVGFKHSSRYVYEILKWLIQKNVKPHMQMKGSEPLPKIVFITQLLNSAKAEIITEEQANALITFVCRNKSIINIQKETDTHGNNLLHLIVSSNLKNKNKVALVKYLLATGSDTGINALLHQENQSCFKKVPWESAVSESSYELAEILIRALENTDNAKNKPADRSHIQRFKELGRNQARCIRPFRAIGVQYHELMSE